MPVEKLSRSIIISFLTGNILARIAPIKEGRGICRENWQDFYYVRKYWWLIEAWRKEEWFSKHHTRLDTDSLRPVTNTLSSRLYTASVREMTIKDIWFLLKRSDCSRLCPADDQIPLDVGHKHSITSYHSIKGWLYHFPLHLTVLCKVGNFHYKGKKNNNTLFHWIKGLSSLNYKFFSLSKNVLHEWGSYLHDSEDFQNIQKWK